MLKGWKARKPNYWLLVFGEDPLKPPVDGRNYPMYKGGYIYRVEKGDVLLLYQNLGAPGVGVVIDTETGGEVEEIDYQFFPLDPAVYWGSLDAVKQDIPELRTPLNFTGNFVQEISDTSFRRAVAGTQIKWR